MNCGKATWRIGTLGLGDQPVQPFEIGTPNDCRRPAHAAGDHIKGTADTLTDADMVQTGQILLHPQFLLRDCRAQQTGSARTDALMSSISSGMLLIFYVAVAMPDDMDTGILDAGAVATACSFTLAAGTKQKDPVAPLAARAQIAGIKSAPATRAMCSPHSMRTAYTTPIPSGISRARLVQRSAQHRVGLGLHYFFRIYGQDGARPITPDHVIDGRKRTRHVDTVDRDTQHIHTPWQPRHRSALK